MHHVLAKAARQPVRDRGYRDPGSDLDSPGAAPREGRADLRSGSRALSHLDTLSLAAAAPIRLGVWAERGRRANGLSLVEHPQGHEPLPGGADAPAPGRGLRAQDMMRESLTAAAQDPPARSHGERELVPARRGELASCYQVVVECL